MPKVTPRKTKERETVRVTTNVKLAKGTISKWWKENSPDARGRAMLDTVAFLKEQLAYRYRQASIHARLYGNMPIFGIGGSSLTKLSTNNQLPVDRPTMNVVQSIIDTKVSRITQSRPRPVFLTDAGDYKERRLAEQLTDFMAGELYQTKAYEHGETILRHAEVLGTGCLKIFEDQENRVAIEPVMFTELLVDPNDALYGNPRQLYQLKLIDRDVLAEMFPKYAARVANAEQAFPDAAGDPSKSVSDQVMVAEGWHLRSGPDANDGKRMIVCSEGVLFEEDYKKDFFPFVFLHDNPRLLGFWGQGAAERLMGTQLEINKMLVTASKSTNLMGVPRVWLEDGSKVVKAHFNNDIGMIGTYRGTLPVVWEGSTGLDQSFYGRLESLIQFAYQQEGISTMAAQSTKPAGLDSGEAIREYDDIQSDRLASLSRRYDMMYVDLAYKMIDCAKDIAERDGKYQTVYPAQTGTREVDLPKAKLLDNPFVIQCFDSSALPRDPAGRKQEVVDRMQAGLLSVDEGKRLLDIPDLEAQKRLEMAAEERILKILDEIVESGKYTPPDPFMDLAKAKDLSNKYYNLYVATGLEEEKADMLRTFNGQAITLLQAAMTPPPGAAGMAPAPLAQPEPTPTSPMVPNVAGAPATAA